MSIYGVYGSVRTTAEYIATGNKTAKTADFSFPPFALHPQNQKVNSNPAYAPDQIIAEGALWRAANGMDKSVFELSSSDLEAAFDAISLACDKLDTSKMSKGEVYSQIESLFCRYLGKDFKEPNIQWVSGYVNRPAAEAYNRFESELRKHGIDGVRDAEVLKASRGYAGLSDDEIRASLRSEYPERMSLRQCMNMAWDLFAMGIEEENYAYQVADRVMVSFWVNSTAGATDHGMTMLAEQAQTTLDAMLDKPADFDTIKSRYETFVENDRLVTGDKDLEAFFSKLLSWFGCDSLYSREAFDEILGVLGDIQNNTAVLGFYTTPPSFS